MKLSQYAKQVGVSYKTAYRWWEDGKRLKPRLVVEKFKKYLHDELDLMR